MTCVLLKSLEIYQVHSQDIRNRDGQTPNTSQTMTSGFKRDHRLRQVHFSGLQTTAVESKCIGECEEPTLTASRIKKIVLRIGH